MNFTEAFRKLGYRLSSPRSDWSAINDAGVCLSLWQREIKSVDGSLSFDTQRDAQPIEIWNHKPGFKRRLDHIARAAAEFGGRVDVVIVKGVPGEGYGDAQPWLRDERQAEWYISAFDPVSGHFVAATRRLAG